MYIAMNKSNYNAALTAKLDTFALKFIWLLMILLHSWTGSLYSKYKNIVAFEC